MPPRSYWSDPSTQIAMLCKWDTFHLLLSPFLSTFVVSPLTLLFDSTGSAGLRSAPPAVLCAEEKALLHFVLSIPLIQSPRLFLLSLWMPYSSDIQSTRCFAVLLLLHMGEPPPDPPYTFSLAETFIKSFLESRQSVTYSTRPFHSNLHLFTEYLFLLGIEVLTRVIFQLFHWANNWHSKVPSENKVKKDWVFRD